MIIKLYKVIDNKLHYWETWNIDAKTAMIHYGVVGERGVDKEIKKGWFSSLAKTIQRVEDKKRREGYAPISADQLETFEIHYSINGKYTEKDLLKRHHLEEKLDQLLGWTGLGHADGGSMGAHSMEVTCTTVNFEMAKKLIIKKFHNTPFADYSEIKKVDYLE